MVDQGQSNTPSMYKVYDTSGIQPSRVVSSTLSTIKVQPKTLQLIL